MLVKNTYSKYAKSAVDTSSVVVNKPCEVVLLKATSGAGAAGAGSTSGAAGAS